MDRLQRLATHIHNLYEEDSLCEYYGTVLSVSPTQCTITGLSQRVKIDSLVKFSNNHFGQIVHIDQSYVTAKPLTDFNNVQIGSRVLLYKNEFSIKPNPSWLGHILNALGEPCEDTRDFFHGTKSYLIDASPPAAIKRQRISKPFLSSIFAIDTFIPLCLGQRIGIFAGSGVGKTTLLSMMARASDFDIIIVALVGERGREVREFIEHAIGAHMSRTILVVSTSDESALMRRMAPKTAMTLAEYFRDQGKSVLLIVDSITRYAHALREVGLAAGEPAVARGFPPSVFADLPKLLERAGPGFDQSGTITAFFSVLVDGDDHNDPIADHVRGTLDGHIVLDRQIAYQGRYPAINLLSSLSRLAPIIWTKEQDILISYLRNLIFLYEESKDIRSVGLYKEGNDPETDKAIQIVPYIYQAFNQNISSPPITEPFKFLAQIVSHASQTAPA